MKDQDKKNKHLTFQDRIEIQECLGKEMTFKDIGKRISKSATTVSREVKGRCITHRSGYTKTDDICKRLLKAPFVCNGCELAGIFGIVPIPPEKVVQSPLRLK